MNAGPDPAKAIFLEAVERHTPDQWAAFLDQACAGQPELRGRVESLLGAHREVGTARHREPAGGADPGPGTTVDLPPATEAPGTVVGPYKLIEPIGEGGMGSVWMAQQTEPVKRLVAVKLIKAGMDSKQVVARFEAERQALALMDHPNIARVLDGGTTGTGRPYFVMDLVKGLPITTYCDEHHLTPRQRLELFLPVCRAVQHAHQKGVIHRDLKPSNVLVAPYDGRPVPKVIDFGVAKAAGQPLTEKTLVTGFGAIVGTLEYMSPEQAEVNQLDIDTRSDIYSLGVLLYELLTGTPPFSRKDLEKAGLLEMLRVIREQEPSKPSTKLSTVEGLPTLAANRGTDPTRLTRLLRGELDWIVMKALEKDRNRRYETANGFAMDVQRYLADEAVEACQPSVSYRFLKYVRRNRLVLTSTAAVVLALAMGLTVSTWLFFEERDARRRAVTAEGEQAGLRQQAETNADRARTEATRSKQVAAFMKDMLKGVDPSVAQGRDTGLLREILDRTAGRLNTLDAAPETEAELRGTLGHVYREIGEYAAAEAMHRRALAIRKGLFGHRSLPAAESLSDLAEALRDQNRAEILQREALSIRRELLGSTHPAVGLSLYRTAMTLSRRDRGADAEPLLREAIALLPNGGNDDPGISPRDQLGLALAYQGKYREAEGQLREALAARRKVTAAPNPLLGGALHNLAWVLREQGKLAEAEPLFAEALEVRRAVLGRRHNYLLQTLVVFSESLRRQGKLEEASRLAGEVVALSKEPPADGNVLKVASSAYWVLGDVRRAQGRLDEAEAALTDAVALGERHSPPEAWFLTNAKRRSLGDLLIDQKKFARAETALVACYEEARRHESDSPARATALRKEAARSLVRLYEATGQPEKAARWREEASPDTGD
jgi:serine/threonine protein kinase/tetratricopeptide (TPR) repeat protein